MFYPDSQICAKHALTPDGWQENVSVGLDSHGCIIEITTGQNPSGPQVGLLLPAVSNLHSHAFQRAMAGMTETRGPDPRDSFWSWRKLMYRFLEHLSPDDVESIAAFGQMEMLESGYTSVGEFHYLHHQPGGKHYLQMAEMCERIIAAATKTGIGLTLLPVLYEQGGCDGRVLSGGQLRFGNSFDEFTQLYVDASAMIKPYHHTMSIGIAPHSLRAVSQTSLLKARTLADKQPFHLHIAEQQAEVDEIRHAWNARPVEWLLANHKVDANWCLIHATQMSIEETQQLAQTGAIVGLCPITESNLGDGVFNGDVYHRHGGRWGIGTDSNIRITLCEELRTLEYSQRLDLQARAVYASQAQSTGRVLYENAAAGGATALGRNTGCIQVGRKADLLALNANSVCLAAVEQDQCLDAWLFAGDDRLITDVWSAGVPVVKDGEHVNRMSISRRYRKTMSALKDRL